MNALTIDLEDWHQLFHRRITGELIPPTSAVVADTHRILDLLDEAGVRATFFVLGLVAEAYPDLVREVARRGHEVGSHTHAHRLVATMTPADFRADLGRSIGHLEDLTGRPVLGFRAPEFSITGPGHWSFEIMAELGIRYDSSVFPLAGPRYGIPDAPRHPFTVATPAGPIREFPLATWHVGRVRLPVAGGTYYRLLPASLLRRGVADLDAAGHPAVLYFHPYEFHRGWLRLAGVAPVHRRRAAYVRGHILYNFRTGSIARRVRTILARFRFLPLAEIWETPPS